MKIFVFLCFALSFMDLCLCGDPVNIKAEPGENVNLPCEADRNSKVSVVDLTRNDLEPECVFLYRDEQIDVNLQNAQYLGRTELLSHYITDRNVNVTITNVTEKDSGEYECRVQTEIRSNTRSKRAASEKTTITIKLSRGHIVPVLVMFAVVAVLAPLAVFVWKKRNVSPPQDETVETLQP
ncbi:butyrophilin subfamily 1 member A1-like [Poeciliopsis prolifica]|uniref:butyrophilin subfamily 1 member A1-like n=1 Tax=Poeciliopsis prolifica TaxID=188132 RepID=UPI0024140F79|nr:butyrophilin subfamily 1 member A1-like [Poeciliopsis prolifica]